MKNNHYRISKRYYRGDRECIKSYFTVDVLKTTGLKVFLFGSYWKIVEELGGNSFDDVYWHNVTFDKYEDALLFKRNLQTKLPIDEVVYENN